MEKQFIPFIQDGISLNTIIIVAVIVIFYILYVGLISKKNNVKEALAGIDTQLKKRYDLIPNILFMANKFMEHERELLTQITELRVQATKISSKDLSATKETFELSDKIDGLMKQLMVAVENYPQLKSNETMIQAMQTYAEQEEHIAAARRFYNSAAKELNNAVEIFPTSIVALLLNIKQVAFIEASEEEKQRIDANQYFTK